MAFCVEAFENSGWKIIKNTIRVSKKEAEDEKKKLDAWVVSENDRFIPVKERLRVRKLKNKEAIALGAKL